MSIYLRKAGIDDIQKIWQMQVDAFSDLLDKYQDYDLSPAAEDAGKIRERFEQPWTKYYFIIAVGIKWRTSLGTRHDPAGGR